MFISAKTAIEVNLFLFMFFFIPYALKIENSLDITHAAFAIPYYVS